jgi:site-specific recombinase XerD
METQILQRQEVSRWLDECRKPSTRRAYASRMKRFFRWYTNSYETFIALDNKELRHLLLQYIAQNPTQKSNTTGAIVNTINSFLLYLDKPVSFRRGEMPKPTPDLDSHNFNNGDLTRMFDVADTRDKALLSLMVSLGWEISAVLELSREQIEQLLNRAKTEAQKFIYWRSFRKKTGVQRLGVLNPLAIEWLGKWLIESGGQEPRKRKLDKKTVDRPVSTIFDLTPEGVNKVLRRLAHDSGLSVTGRVHVHRIRAWVMSGLSRAGWNEFQIKFLVGKAIPVQDSTYLTTLELEIQERYPKAYADYLNIKPERIVKVVDEETRRKAAAVEQLLKRVEELEKRLEGMS